MSNMRYTFDDYLIKPQFSEVRSRADVSLSQFFLGLRTDLPIMSANMDTVTEEKMAATMNLAGGIGVLHRFSSVGRTIEMFLNTIEMTRADITCKPTTNLKPMISVGLGEAELERASSLKKSGATHFVIDIAHGASIACVEQYDAMRDLLGQDVYIIVGNFSDANSIRTFQTSCISNRKPDAYKVGVGGGSMCTTRIQTGCGDPTLASGMDCVATGLPIILDGGIRNSGDIAKSLAIGAKMVMIGGILAGTDETPGDVVQKGHGVFKKYRGSASRESYVAQGKSASHRAPEGESTLLPCKGSANSILEELNGGIRSALAYTGSFDLGEFREKAQLQLISNNSITESRAHGKK